MTHLPRILITGATSGIGEAVAMLAAQRGYQVWACGRNADKLDALSARDNITAVQFDVTDTQACQTALADVEVDIVLLNAGTCEYVDLPEIDPAMFKRVFDANILGVINVLSAINPNLQPGNKVVFVDSMARLLPFPRSQAYGASKAALHYMAKCFEVDYAPLGIKVQTASPGFVRTPLTDKNDFDMPMRIEVDQAASDILKGIEKGKSSFYFPSTFGWILRTLNTLPESLQVSIARRLSKQ